jgi:hypothetical protein
MAGIVGMAPVVRSDVVLNLSVADAETRIQRDCSTVTT